MNFKGRNIVSITDLSREEIEYILKVAKDMRPFHDGGKVSKSLEGKILATFFFEPSTRTRLSFETAMFRLGGNVIGFSDISATSVKKGETLADTIRMGDAYADAVVLRHPNEGSARLAAQFSTKPVINGGDGAGQHPTQTLLDLFTIQSEKGNIDGNHIALVGDLKYGRTVHSLAEALMHFDVKLTFVAPKQLQMPKEVVEHVRASGLELDVCDDLGKVADVADILYVTRIQKERFVDVEEYRKVANIFRVDMELLESTKDDLVIMHPLPRVDEIAPEVDKSQKAAYFRQANNGVLVRMALLQLVLTGVGL